jgi:hypothetical protein
MMAGTPDDKLCKVCHKPLISHSWDQQKVCAQRMSDYYKGDKND